MTSDISEIDELERKLIASDWLSTKAPVLEGEDFAIASKLLGGAGEAARFNDLKSGQRFRHRPIRTTKVEYFYLPPDDYHAARGNPGWRIEVFENGRRRERPFAFGLSDDQCLMALKALQTHGFKPRMVITEGMRSRGLVLGPSPGRIAADYAPLQQKRPPSKPRQQPSKRHAILKQLAGFRL